MLELRRNRLDYTGELLCPPEGYRFERAVATTYSLDLETLLAVLLPLALGSSPDTPQVLHCQPLLLQALNRVGSRLTVFHQAGQIPVPKRDSPLYALLDCILVPVALKRFRNAYPSFHPKTWTIEYRNDVGEVRYRFVVLSRNLTFDRSLDVAISLESGADRRRTRSTRPLCDFLGYLARHVDKGLPHAQEHARRAEGLAKGLATHPLALDSDKTWDGFEISPLLGDGLPDDPLFSDDEPPGREFPNRVVAISPFLSDRVVAQMAGRARKDEKDAMMTLVTRPDAWASLSPASRRGIEAWALKDQVAVPEALPGEVDEDADAEVSRMADLHAKLYCWQRPRETCLLLGSMNATESGLHRNVELLVRLWGNPRSFGCEALRKDLFGKAPELDANPFERLRDDATLSPSESLKEETNRALQETVQLFCRCGGKGRVECNDGGHWELVVDIPQEFVPPTGIHCSLRPMASKPESAQPVRGTLRFGGLRNADLSPLFVFAAEKANCRIERVVRLPVEGIDEETRDKAVADAAIEAGGGWANALALLFSEEPYYTASEQIRRRGEGGERTGGPRLPPGLYEKMLFVVASPDGRERFAEAESLLARYAGEDAQRVKDLLEVFRKALGRDAGGRQP